MKKKRLSDTYGFKGYIPQQIVEEVVGDLQGRIIKLKRRQKKQNVLNADIQIKYITTVKKKEYVICPVVNFVYTFHLKYEELNVNGAVS